LNTIQKKLVTINFWSCSGKTTITIEKRKPQYASKIFYLNEEQRKKAEESKIKYPGSVTDIEYLDKFYVAEDYHQKYRLRHSDLMKNFKDLDEKEFRDSALAAKLNGFVAGYLDLEDLENLDFEVEPSLKQKIISRIRTKL